MGAPLDHLLPTLTITFKMAELNALVTAVNRGVQLTAVVADLDVLGDAEKLAIRDEMRLVQAGCATIQAALDESRPS